MPRVVAYLRVSTDRQAAEGVSLDAQEGKVRQYAELHGLELVEIVRDEGVSARTLDRPGLGRALAMLDAGDADGLLVAKLDRLTRSVVDLGRLLEERFAERAALHSVADRIDTSSASGRLILHVLTSVAQWEREVIAERTTAALAHKRSRGEYTGGRPPYGWRLAPDGVHLEEEPAEQAVIAEARALRAEGRSLRAIAAELEARGRRSRRGGRLHAPAVGRMLRVG